MFIKLVRLGADAELKYLQNGNAVLNLSAAYNVGYGDKKKPQWLRLAMFGKRAETSAQHLTKGTAIVAQVQDLHIDTFDGKDGPVSQLKGTLADFEFAGGNGAGVSQSDGVQRQQSAPQQRQQSAPAPQQSPSGGGFEDDIPFAPHERFMIV